MPTTAALAAARQTPASAAVLRRRPWAVIETSGQCWNKQDGANTNLGALREIGAVSTFDRNETIFNEGDSAEYSFKVVSGAVRLCKMLPDGRRQIADFFLPGDFFALGGESEHTFTAEAISEVVVVCFQRRRIERLCDEAPEIRKDLLSRLYGDLSAAQNHLVMLGRQSAKERIASFLLLLAGRVKASNGESIGLPMGRQDIADYLGLTIETVCRALSDLKRSKLITTPNTHQVVLNNIEALQALTEKES
jgi:CRP-like cAMP-binding protein